MASPRGDGALSRRALQPGSAGTPQDIQEPEAAQPKEALAAPVLPIKAVALPVMVPLSLPEVRRLYWYLVSARSLAPLHRLAWSPWRRSHHALAKLCHYKRHMAHLHYLQL